MIIVPISAVPNQSFSITLDGNAYDLALYVTTNIMAMDIIRNNIPIVLGLRVVPYYPVIPYKYLENGNFIFNTENGDYPYYDQFNVTQQLIYLSQTELNQLRAQTA
jgi:hypothetical protein